MLKRCFALLVLAAAAAASSACPAGCRCSQESLGGCAVAAFCPCGTKIGAAKDLDCVFFQQPQGKYSEWKAAGNGFLKDIPATARRVDLFSCGIGEIPAGSLSHLSQVRVLNLEYNGLTRIGADAFKGMKKLKVLWLTGHHLQKHEFGPSGSGEREQQPMAEYVATEQHKNAITQIDATAFAHNPQLAVLLMHHNKISSLPDTVFSTPASALRVLKLLDNGAPLRSLTKGKGPLTGLGGCHQLDLQDDSGDQLEDWMEGMNHYLDDDNGDSSQWWTRTQNGAAGGDGDDGQDGQDEM